MSDPYRTGDRPKRLPSPSTLARAAERRREVRRFIPVGSLIASFAVLAHISSWAIRLPLLVLLMGAGAYAAFKGEPPFRCPRCGKYFEIASGGEFENASACMHCGLERDANNNNNDDDDDDDDD